MVASPRAAARNHRQAPIAFYADLDRLLQPVNDIELRGVLRETMWEMIEWSRQGFEVTNGLMSGAHNAHGLITLTLSVATSTLADRRIRAQTKIILTPHTANASAEFGNGTIFITHPNVTKGQAVINHANSGTTGRTFGYILAG